VGRDRNAIRQQGDLLFPLPFSIAGRGVTDACGASKSSSSLHNRPRHIGFTRGYRKLTWSVLTVDIIRDRDESRTVLVKQLVHALQCLQFYRAWVLADALAKATDGPLSARLEILAAIALGYHERFSAFRAHPMLLALPQADPCDLVCRAFHVEVARLNQEIDNVQSCDSLRTLTFAYYALLQLDGCKAALFLAHTLEASAHEYVLPDPLNLLRVSLLGMVDSALQRDCLGRRLPATSQGVSIYESFQRVQDYIAATTGVSFLDIVSKFGFYTREEQLIGETEDRVARKEARACP
jgi:hypothetical protein